MDEISPTVKITEMWGPPWYLVTGMILQVLSTFSNPSDLNPILLADPSCSSTMLAAFFSAQTPGFHFEQTTFAGVVVTLEIRVGMGEVDGFFMV